MFMAKIRVHEIAKQFDMPSKDLVPLLAQLGVEAKTHMSAINEKDAEKIIEYLKSKTKTSAETAPAQAQAPAPQKAETPLGAPPQVYAPAPTAEEPPPAQAQAEAQEPPAPQQTVKKTAASGGSVKEEEKIIEIPELITVGELAKILNISVNEIIKNLLKEGLLLTINQNLDFKKAEEIAAGYNYLAVKKETPHEAKKETRLADKGEKLINRPPVVTVLGHVDHGKTSLLDAIRKTNIAGGEAGGITQRIGASTIEIKGKKIIVIDTPGHEAFTSMRARGAKVTDIAILVVAADDGIMPQTIEAINHAKAAKVPIIVAINKIDLPQSNPERVKQQLTDYELLPEDWGGETICVNVSAKQKIGIEDLLEMITLVSDMHEIKADPDGMPYGIIIEAKIDKGMGPVATVIVQNGTLRTGDTILAGTSYGKIRFMINDKGERLTHATPSTPVEIIGFTTVPSAGDTIEMLQDERDAKQIAEERLAKCKEEKTIKHHASLDDLFKQISTGAFKELNIVIKADGQGSIEALRHALLNIKSSEVGIKIIHTGVGTINESDIMLATASNAIIIGFNVRPDADMKKLAEGEGVDLRMYRVIYHVIEDVKAALTGMLSPEYEEVLVGQAVVKQIFKISKIGIVAGSYVSEGKMKRGADTRIIRDGVVVYEGKITTLRRFKDDAKEVAAGYECGITIEKFGGLQPNDIIEAYMLQEKEKRELILHEPANQQTK